MHIRLDVNLKYTCCIMYNAVNINGTIIFLHPSNIQTTKDDGYFVEKFVNFFFTSHETSEPLHIL